MKKVFSLLFCAVMVFSCFMLNVEASTYTEDEVITSLVAAEDNAKDLISDLKNWADSYSSTLESLFTKDVLDNLTVEDYGADIDLIIAKLNELGKTEAAIALSAIKVDIVNNLNSLKTTINMTEQYLKENVAGGVAGSIDLFIQIRQTAKKLKDPLGDIADIFYTKYYDKASQKLDEVSSLEEAEKVLEALLEKLETMDSLVSKLDSKLLSWQWIYNDYYLSDYEDVITGYFQDYYKKFKEDYNKLYEKVETKLQNKLESKVHEIVDNADYNTSLGITSANDELIDIALVIDDVLLEVYDLYYSLEQDIEVEKVLTTAQEYLQQIINRITEARDYVLSYVVTDIVVANEQETPYITFDRENKLIFYDNTNLNADEVLAKLYAIYGDLGFTYTYDYDTDNRIGTNSVIYAFKDLMVLKEYLVIVRGDIAPSGTFDITDVVKLCNKLFETEELDQYQLLAADLDGNSKIDITDVVMLCNILFG